MKPLCPDDNDFSKGPFSFLAWTLLLGLLVITAAFLGASQTPPTADQSFYEVSCGPLGSYLTAEEPFIQDGYLRFRSIEQNDYMVARDRCIIRIPRK